MIQWILRKLVGSKNQRELRRVWPLVQLINEEEKKLQSQPDSVLREKTAGWRAELAALPKEKHQAYLDKILPEAFAVVKNGARRLVGTKLMVCDQELSWEMVHFDVQLIGGIALHQGKIAEMGTGEGKTLVATLPLYLNALTGRGVHIITVNDYLARRDSEWMGYLLEFLGVSVGVIQNDMRPHERKEMYGRDVTYGTNSEFGFDYLRDNGMAESQDEQVQRGHFFAIVDEVDSVLIDEARTPLIISGPVQNDNQQYDVFAPMVSGLVRKQTELTNRLASEARELAAQKNWDEVGPRLFKIKMGAPRHKQLMRMMEDPEFRRSMEKAELACYQDPQKRQLYAYREELYFHMDERNHEADISEIGRRFLDESNPDAFTLPDIGSEFAEIDQNRSLDLETKAKAKMAVQERMDNQAQKLHSISQLLRAYTLYEKDVHYVVEGGKVMIVDEHTGRKMPGRRWSEGLHQSVEAKEGVRIEPETQTLATITIQNYFRLYAKLGGMTGTAETEAAEFSDIYKLDLLIIPPNREVSRKDYNDKIFKTQREKYNAVIALIKERHELGQPILVGTGSVVASETVSRMMQREKIPHQVLNARYHMQEAEIIAKAGQRGAVTVSTNMAGRGTDIKLGEGVSALGGLLVVGTERFESRRIDRQLRGRCARQGDPGESIFFLSFEDPLMLNFGAAERMTRLMERMGMEDGQELEHPWLNKSIETAQKRVEQRNYMQRKHTLEYDDVMNKQRGVVYSRRSEILTAEKPGELVDGVIEDGLSAQVQEQTNVENGQVHTEDLVGWVNVNFFPTHLKLEDLPKSASDVGGITKVVVDNVKATYARKVAAENQQTVHELERYIMLQAIDNNWRDHLYAMDSLRDNTRFQHVAQKDPLVEYKKSAYDKFAELMRKIDAEILRGIFNLTTDRDSYQKFVLGMLQQYGLAVPSEMVGAPQGSGQPNQNVSNQPQPQAKAPARPAEPQLPSMGGGSQTMTFGGGGGGGGSFTLGSGGLNMRPAPAPAPKQEPKDG